MRVATGSFGTPDEAIPAGVDSTLGPQSASAEVLDEFGSYAVIAHNVTVPHRAEAINHIVVAGSAVLMVDSQMWSPGFYHCLFRELRRNVTSRHEYDHEAFETLCYQAAQSWGRQMDDQILWDNAVLVWAGEKKLPPTVVSWSCRRLEPKIMPADPYLLSTVDAFISKHGMAEPELAGMVIAQTDGTVRVRPQADPEDPSPGKE